MPWNDTYKRIEYAKCKIFNDGKGGRRESVAYKNGRTIWGCYGATYEPTEWADICEECFDCPKYIRNIEKVVIK